MTLIHSKVENLNGALTSTKSFAILVRIEDENFYVLQPGSAIEESIPRNWIFQNHEKFTNGQNLEFSGYDLWIDNHAVGLRLE